METWGGAGEAYPSVELSQVPKRALSHARVEENFEEFARLRELVRPLVPAGAPLAPGAEFGPLVGTAWGNFPQLHLQNPWALLVRRDALTTLQAEGLRGLAGCRTELTFRGTSSVELLELQVEAGGMLHPDCLPPGKAAPCATCGRYDFSLPRDPILDGASLPHDRDLFRLRNFQTVIVGTNRFVDAVQRLGFEEVGFRELPVRHMH
jgi:uncharacterized double-CXXCG motif protein